MDRPQIRIRLKGKQSLKIPDICPVTGNPAQETHTVSSFGWYLYFITTRQLALPFSEDGWNKFQRDFPHSLRVYRAGVNVAAHVPLFGGFLAILWLVAAALPCSVIAIFDLVQNRCRRLVSLHNLEIRDGEVRAIDISVPSQQFAEELVRLNTDLSLDEYQHQFKRKQSVRTMVAGLPAVAACILLLTGSLVGEWSASRKPILVAGFVCLFAALLAYDITRKGRWVKAGRIEQNNLSNKTDAGDA